MKILLLDLDGTIRCSTTGNFIESPKGQKPMLGADKAIEHFAACDWQIVGISNQGGIAGGYKTLAATIEEMKYTLQLFPKLKSIYFCPDFQGRDCIHIFREGNSKFSLDDKEGYKELIPIPGLNFRKPGVGMLVLAVEKIVQTSVENFLYEIKQPDSNWDCWFVGDRQEDQGAAELLGINYLDAEIWRRRFLPGMHEFNQLTPTQVRFLEGIKICG